MIGAYTPPVTEASLVAEIRTAGTVAQAQDAQQNLATLEAANPAPVAAPDDWFADSTTIGGIAIPNVALVAGAGLLLLLLLMKKK